MSNAEWALLLAGGAFVAWRLLAPASTATAPASTATAPASTATAPASTATAPASAFNPYYKEPGSRPMPTSSPPTLYVDPTAVVMTVADRVARTSETSKGRK